MTSIKKLIEKRRPMRTSLTKRVEAIASTIEDIDLKTKLQHVDLLNALKQKIILVNDEVMNLMLESESVTEAEIDTEYNLCEEYSERISSALISLQLSMNSDSTHTEDQSKRLGNQVKLPVIPLPKYGHTEGEDLIKFLANFEQIIIKYNLTSYEKFIYLQKQLENEPLTLIKSLEISNQNYESAKELLVNAFASTVTQQFKTLDRLCKLKFAVGDDPYGFISDMRLILESFETLKIDANIVLQYFIWNSMNSNLKTIFIQMTNCNKPSLSDIRKHLFPATERYQNLYKKIKPLKSKDIEHAAYAATAIKPNSFSNYSKLPLCGLCSDKDNKITSHSSSNCDKYTTPEAKIKKLKSVNGCTKCCRTNHSTDQCRFKFRSKCFKCKKYHFHFLCSSDCMSTDESITEKGANKPGSKHQSKSKDIHKGKPLNSSSVYVGKIATEQYGEDSIIPTFSVRFADHSVLRGMRDSGCQPSFITNEAAKRLNLPIVETKFPLSINGFNSTESHLANIVELTIEENDPPIKAICVPHIRTKLNLPNLKEVVDAFVAKGYHIADEFLTDSNDRISDLDFILGNNDAQVLPQNEIRFGNPPSSIFSLTPRGVMLTGSVSRMLENMSQLNDCCVSFNNRQCYNTQIESDLDKNLDVSENYFNAESISNFKIDPGVPINYLTIDRAIEQIDNRFRVNNLIYDYQGYNEKSRDIDDELVNRILNSIVRTPDGRLQIPLLWNEKVVNRLGNNFNLSKSILKSNLKRLEKSPKKLQMYDEVIKQQTEEGIIEMIDDIKLYSDEHPNISFLPHMGVFKLERESSKCRIVFLSNLTEKSSVSPDSISHNQAMFSGPNLNQKVVTALTKLRFEKYICCFDIKKAFLNIALTPADQNKTLFLWFRNISKRDFSIVGYKCLRLPYGFRCSPSILMLALYHMLVIEPKLDDEDLMLKKLIYDCIYMDNGCITSNDSELLFSSYLKLEPLFSSYGFGLQQFITNDESLMQKIDTDQSKSESKILGINYNCMKDTFNPSPIRLNEKANTKRMILSTIATNYDVLQVQGPILNRARLFVHNLQCRPKLGWDEKLKGEESRDWKNICNQVNKTPALSINRSMGERDSEFEMILFTDASKVMLGSVIYIKDIKSNKISFLQAQNRIVTRQLETKSIPALELHAMSLGVQFIIDTYRELTCDRNLIPLKINKLTLFSDSLVALNWVNAHVNKLDKLQKLTPFVKNRLDSISRWCEHKPINFEFVAGSENPADYITRPISYNQLSETCYLTGPSFLNKFDPSKSDNLSFSVPSIIKSENKATVSNVTVHNGGSPSDHIVSLDNYSCIDRITKVYRNIFIFINNLKLKLKKRDAIKYAHLTCLNIDENLNLKALKHIIKMEQSIKYPEVVSYFSLKEKRKIKIPNIVSQLNLFIDEDGIVRVRSKFKQWKYNENNEFPILLPKNGALTRFIVLKFHNKLSHAGKYSLISQLRKEFFIPTFFNVVRKILKECMWCKRINARSVKLNQSYYRDFRCNPPQVPFRSLFLDHFGPYNVTISGVKQKVWVLCVTCLWTRAINLKLCYNLTVKEFIRTFQLHIFDYGLPEAVFSDLGSQLVAGANIITDLLSDIDAKSFFKEKNLKVTTFTQYFKGNNSLGSLVETCVKLSKRLLNSAIKNTLLTFIEFEFFLSQTNYLVNKRPIAFHESLREGSVSDEVPDPITPELLIKGFDTPTLNIVPSSVLEKDSDWKPEIDSLKEIKVLSKKLENVRIRLKHIYHEEFLGSLMYQAINQKDRFAPVTHKILNVGDIILLKESNTKAINYPMAIVKEIIINDLGEVTNVIARKGNREIVKRHVDSVIPYLTATAEGGEGKSPVVQPQDSGVRARRSEKRKAAVVCEERNKIILSN